MSRNRKTICRRFVSSGIVKIRDESTSDWLRLPLVLLFMTFPFKGRDPRGPMKARAQIRVDRPFIQLFPDDFFGLNAIWKRVKHR